MAYAPINAIAGAQPFNELMTPDTTQRFAGGFVLDAVDPYFGFGRFVYLKAGAAHNPGRLVIFSDQTFAAIDLPNSTLLGLPFLVARQVMAQNAWGWYQFEGMTPIQGAFAGAVHTAIAIGGPGVAGASAVSKQLIGVNVLQNSTFALTKVGTTTTGSPIIQLSNVDGLFYGLAVSGTGIPGASTLTGSPNPIDANQRQVVLNNNATANGTVTVTFTYTGFSLCYIHNPTGQGAIT